MARNSPNSSVSGIPEAEIYSVSRLNREARRLLETGLARVWIAGEISNLARPASGHIYFTLKDSKAQVRCAMFRTANRRLRVQPDNGTQVLVQAKVSVYEPRGDYQVIVERLEEAGEGLLRRKFEELKLRLDAAGLFDVAHKQALPTLPASIGVVTSPSGAAIRDILNILKRRFPSATVIIYPTRVQGAGANDEIVAAIETADSRSECDVLIVARGGGSLEDLWSFNEENVAQAIFECSLPVVAGIGHEIDVTIADLVADLRAPTPSGAAELIVPDRDVLLQSIDSLQRRALLGLGRLTTSHARRHADLEHRLQLNHPGAVVRQAKQSLDELNARLASALDNRLARKRADSMALRHRLRNNAPGQRIAHLAERVAMQQQRLQREMEQTLSAGRHRLATIIAGLNTVSPLATLERGYSIVAAAESGEVIRSTAQVQTGDRIRARLADGELEAEVTKTGRK